MVFLISLNTDARINLNNEINYRKRKMQKKKKKVKEDSLYIEEK